MLWSWRAARSSSTNDSVIVTAPTPPRARTSYPLMHSGVGVPPGNTVRSVVAGEAITRFLNVTPLMVSGANMCGYFIMAEQAPLCVVFWLAPILACVRKRRKTALSGNPPAPSSGFSCAAGRGVIQ